MQNVGRVLIRLNKLVNLKKQVDNLLSKNISLADACTQRRLEVEKLETVNHSLRDRLCSVEEERDVLGARITSMDDITSWQQVKEKTRRSQSQQHTPLRVIPPPPPPPLPNTVPCNSRVSNPASVWVYGSSMARGVAAHLNKYAYVEEQQ